MKTILAQNNYAIWKITLLKFSIRMQKKSFQIRAPINKPIFNSIV